MEAARMGAQHVSSLLQLLPVVAGEVWQPAPTWQRLLGQCVAGEAHQHRLVRLFLLGRPHNVGTAAPLPLLDACLCLCLNIVCSAGAWPLQL
jgi:hypothetical protein